MIVFKRFSYNDKELMKYSNEIRRRVFIDEQNVDPNLEYEYEEEANYYLMFIGDKPLATARWRETEKGIKLERFAMLKEYRNKGLGAKLLEEIMKDVLPLERKIYLHSQVDAINYYKRAGFLEKGEYFYEAEIEHVLMEYDPSVN